MRKATFQNQTAAKRSPLRVGVVSLENAAWSAGGSYSRGLALALQGVAQEAELEVYQLADEKAARIPGASHASVGQADASAKGALVRFYDKRRGTRTESHREWALRSWLGLLDRSQPDQVALAHNLDVVVPYLLPRPAAGVHTVGWIPDFQHRGLPEYFTKSEREHRDRVYGGIAAASDRVILSSAAALDDFYKYMPERAHLGRILSFPSLFAYSPPPDAQHDVCDIYGLPRKFALVANQFWAHKNHLTVVQAAARLRLDGLTLPLVMVGRPSDYRDSSNKTLSDLLQAVSVKGLRDSVAILGEVPYPHLVALLRTAAVVIQPSRFEGWSTTVQDARALGRSLLCADIPVLREQAPDALGFFPATDDSALARELARVWPQARQGPDIGAERLALQSERSFAEGFGRRLALLCYEACDRRPPASLL